MDNKAESDRLVIANKKLIFQNEEGEKRAGELVLANKELVFQNEEKVKRADELILVNDKLKKAEEKLQNVNRLYAFISHINQTIVKVKDEQRLFKEACRIAIDEGKFKMAWIGIADTSSRKIRLVASYGTTKRDLEILANKTYDLNGPTEKVLEGKDFYTIMDVQKEKGISWSDYGAERGFNSAISLPLKKSGKVIGTFDLYSSETNFFDKEEVKMLQEAVGDISFGIDILIKAQKQKETEELLNENEKRFRALIEKSTDVITLTTFEGEVMYGSPSVTKVFGYTFAEYFHKQVRDFIHPDDFPGFSESIKDILQTPGKSFFRCQRLLHKDGSWMWCEGTVTNMLAEPGIYALVSNFHDITERKKTEEKLLQSEKRFRLLIEKSADMKTLSSREGKVIYSSPSVEKALGYTTEEYLLKYPTDIIHPDDLQDYLEKRSKLLETPGKSFHFEQRRLHKNGDWVWCEGTVTNQLNQPEINALVSNFRDISEKKARESEHEFDRNNLNALINNTSDLMWSVDKDFNLITSNEPFDEMSKINFGRIIPKGGSVLSAAYNPEMLKHFKQLYERAFAGEAFTETDHFDYPVEMWTEISYYPIRRGDEVIGTACHSRDITARKAAEDNLKQSEATLKEAESIAHVGNFAKDLLCGTEIWSDEFYKIFGFAKGEITPSPESFLSLVHHEDKNIALQKIKGGFENFNDYSFTVRCVRKDLSIIICYAECRFELNENKKAIRLFGVIQDITERTEREEEIKSNEIRFRNFFENAPEAILVLDLASLKFVKVNANATKLFKFSNEEFSKKGPADISPEFQPDGSLSVEKARCNIEKAMQGEKVAFEWIHCNADGKEIMCEVHLALLPDVNRPQIYASINNIAERKKSEETSLRLASIVEFSLEAIIGLSLGGVIESWNHAAKILYEYSAEEVIGKPYADLFNPDKAEEFSKNVERMKVGEQLGHFESEHFKKSGELIYVMLSVSPIKDAAGKLTGISISGQNINEQKRAEAVLNRIDYKEKVKSKRKLRVELAIGIILSLILYFLSFTFNLPEKLFNVIGNPANSVLDDLVLVMAFLFVVAIVFGFRRAMMVERGGLMIQSALRALTKELEMRVQERTNDFSKSNEVLRGEIIDRQKAEQNLEQQNKELKKTNTELDRFVYSTSHDLRAPLSSLLGLIEMVNDDIEPGKTLQIEHMGMMKQSVLKLDNFIEDILNYSRNARTELAKDDIVFENLIQEARAEHKFMEGTTGFKLKVEVKQTKKFISDNGRIHVILNNLISNAVKYKDTAKEKSFVHISVLSDEKHATIMVEDNGIGIAEKDKEKIFEMFYRATKQSTGSGLGLYIVKETLDKLGASITLESEKSVGSKFTVTIPNLLNDES